MTDKDSAQAALADIPISPGDQFRHYKAKGLYEVVTLAVKEDTLEPLVVYRSVDYGNTVWVRTVKNFMEEIALPDGSKTKRFTPRA